MKGIIAVLSLFTAIAAYGEWELEINVDEHPSSYIGDWKAVPGITEVTISYEDAEEETVTVWVTLNKEGEGEITNAKSGKMVFTPSTSKTIDNTRIFGLDGWDNYVEEFAEAVKETGRIPEGNYNITLEVQDLSGEVNCSDEVTFVIKSPLPPRLLYPFDFDTVSVLNPTFQWSPVSVSPPREIIYAFKVCEMKEGQTRFQAIDNKPIYETKIEKISLPFSLSKYPLENNKMYVWWVRALDKSLKPIVEGENEIRTFLVKSPQPLEIEKIDIIIPDTVNVGERVKPTIKIKGKEGTVGQVSGMIYLDGAIFQSLNRFVSKTDSFTLPPIPTTADAVGIHKMKVSIASPAPMVEEKEYCVK